MMDHDAHEAMLAMLRKQRAIPTRPEPEGLPVWIILAIAGAVGAAVGLLLRVAL